MKYKIFPPHQDPVTGRQIDQYTLVYLASDTYVMGSDVDSLHAFVLYNHGRGLRPYDLQAAYDAHITSQLKPQAEVWVVHYGSIHDGGSAVAVCHTREEAMAYVSERVKQEPGPWFTPSDDLNVLENGTEYYSIRAIPLLRTRPATPDRPATSTGPALAEPSPTEEP